MNGIRVSGSEKISNNKYPISFWYLHKGKCSESIWIFNLYLMNDNMSSVLLGRTKYKTKGNTDKKTCQQNWNLEFIFRYFVTCDSVLCIQYLYRVFKYSTSLFMPENSHDTVTVDPGSNPDQT
jgi:hypothetical protein